MNKIALLFGLLLSCQTLLAKELVIISDLDETLREANVENHLKAGLKLIAGVKPYEGMRAIFQEIKAKNPDAKFYYLSNSFSFLYNGEKWVEKNGFPEGTSFQRCLSDKSTEFKPKKLREIVAAHPDASIMMFGDNIEHDPDFYRDLVADAHLTDAQVFIRDARLIFTQEPGMTYFQTEDQITDDLNMSAETAEAVHNLPFNKLVPNFLLKNLRKRLVETCKSNGVESCSEQADNRVKEVVETIRPGSAESMMIELASEEE